ncbi:hypothetical protein JCM10213_003168 [Rhodosporidiobolus nylandii]
MRSKSVLSTTLALIALQISSRLLSFGLNQALLRSTSPAAFGLATIRFDTLIGTVLFLLREGVRGAVVRTRSTSSTPSASRLRRQTYLLPVLLSPLALLSFLLYSHLSTPPSPPSYFNLTLTLYTLSTLLELFSEPLYLRTLEDWESLTTGRVRVEGAATLLKAVATLAVVRSVEQEDALLAFGAGQLVYSASIWAGLALLLYRFSPTAAAATPVGGVGISRVEGRYLDPEIKELGWALTKQSVVKQLLTEGDKLAVGRFGSSEDMGGYAVALNYGSLIARILFQPLEESSRLYFSSLSSSPSLLSLYAAATHLRLLLLLHSHLTLLFLLLAPSFTTPLLRLLLGPMWSTTAGPILRSYALSLPFLAFNGLTEAFFQSCASPRWIARGSWAMAGAAVAFAASVAVFQGVLGWGAQGLVAANCVNMLLRTAFSSVFISRFFASSLAAAQGNEAEKERVKKQLAWSSWSPNTPTVAAFMLGGYAVRASEGRWDRLVKAAGGRGLRPTVEHLAVGGAVGVACLAVVFLTRRNEIRSLFSSMRRSKAEEKKAE